ncbi:hypothetical protein GCM10028816_28730 [Spirosoma lituiforme]
MVFPMAAGAVLGLGACVEVVPLVWLAAYQFSVPPDDPIAVNTEATSFSQYVINEATVGAAGLVVIVRVDADDAPALAGKPVDDLT